MSHRAPYPIAECCEPLEPIPGAVFSLATPHPYVALGAPYAGAGPWYLRREVLARLRDAQRHLATTRPGWRLHLLDAWRPVPVQAFMVAHTTRLISTSEPGLSPAEVKARVLQFWAPPSTDPATPPPHATGAAVDLSLVDAQGVEVDMGSAFDEPSERSWPDAFRDRSEPELRLAHAHRVLLREVMARAGFVQHPNEWWHFSWGDRAWARATGAPTARYGATFAPG